MFAAHFGDTLQSVPIFSLSDSCNKTRIKPLHKGIVNVQTLKLAIKIHTLIHL